MPIKDNGSTASKLTMQGRELYLNYNQADNKKAQDLFHQAIASDPNYADAYGWLAYAMQWEAREGWKPNRQPDSQDILDYARKGVALDPSSYYAHWCLADVLSGAGKLDEALKEFNTALSLNPDPGEKFDLLVEIADVLGCKGYSNIGLVLIEQAIKERPDHPAWYLWSKGFAHHMLKQFPDAVTSINDMGTKTKILANPAILTRVAAQARSVSRSEEEVGADLDLILNNSPQWNPDNIKLMEPLARAEDRELWLGSFQQLTNIALKRSPK
jgi:tetratricopeptide (TPR) repeat protein